MPQKKVENGIKNMASLDGRIGSQYLSSAYIVKKNSLQNHITNYFAQMHVNQHGEDMRAWMMLKRYVFFAKKSLGRTNMLKSEPVQCPALPNYVGVKGVRKKENENVYCLTTMKNGNFIANGMVIKNCDAMRYAVYTHFYVKEQGRMTARDVDTLYNQAMGGSDLPPMFRDFG